MEQYRSLRSLFILYTKGIVMGAADIIPGVSGGTIALISGIYEHLIDAISSAGFREILAVLRLPFTFWIPEKRERDLNLLGQIPWFFLLSLVAGILTGILTMSRIIPAAMEEFPFYTYAFFFGLIVFSLTIPFRHMNHAPLEYLVILIFATGTFFVVGYSSISGATIRISGPGIDTGSSRSLYSTDNNGRWTFRIPDGSLAESSVLTGEVTSPVGSSLGTFSLRKGEDEKTGLSVESHLSEATIFIKKVTHGEGLIEIQGALALNGSGTPLHLFLSGFFAISAMILPGISGAYILVLLGEYKTVLTALHNHDFATLVSFLAGIATGIFLFIRVLKYLLHHYHSITMAALTGIMAGSLRKIWPTGYLDGSEDFITLTGGVAIALFGAILVFTLERASIRMEDPDPPI